MRFTKKDKKYIAEYQNQVVEYEDDWGDVVEIAYICKKCRREFDLDILEVDHIIPLSRRGTDRPSNLQLLCPICNKKKGSKVKEKSSTTKRKNTTVKRKNSTVKRKSSTVKRKRR